MYHVIVRDQDDPFCTNVIASFEDEGDALGRAEKERRISGLNYFVIDSRGNHIAPTMFPK